MTVPKTVRDARGIRSGDQVVFRLDGNRATLVRTANFLELEGSVPVLAAERGAAWDEVVRRTRSGRAASRH